MKEKKLSPKTKGLWHRKSNLCQFSGSLVLLSKYPSRGFGQKTSPFWDSGLDWLTHQFFILQRESLFNSPPGYAAKHHHICSLSQKHTAIYMQMLKLAYMCCVLKLNDSTCVSKRRRKKIGRSKRVDGSCCSWPVQG